MEQIKALITWIVPKTITIGPNQSTHAVSCFCQTCPLHFAKRSHYITEQGLKHVVVAVKFRNVAYQVNL